MFEQKPYKKLFKSCHQLTRKLRRKGAKKVNMECDTDENFQDDQGYFTVFPAIMFSFELRAKFLH
jgi:hypothetical protein